MSIQFKTPSVTSIARGVIAYLKTVFICGFAAGAILGNGYANLGKGHPDVSTIPPMPEDVAFGGELFIPFIKSIAQFFATVSYTLFFWIPYPVFGVLVMGIIAYFGIYRVGEKGWVP